MQAQTFNKSNVDEPEDGQKRYIYVFIRTDISLEQQMVQANHAAAEAGRLFYRPDHGIASLVTLAVRNPARLAKAQRRLESLGLEHTVFFEPDWQMGYSAIGTRPVLEHERRHFREWQLWKPQVQFPTPQPEQAQEVAAC